jgi:hypothetical protein
MQLQNMARATSEASSPFRESNVVNVARKGAIHVWVANWQILA